MKWFHRKPKALSATEALEAEFNEVMRKVNEASPVARACVGYGVAFAWKIFNAEFSSMDEFRRQSRSRQLDFMKKFTHLETIMTENNDPQVALGVALTKMYFAPLIEGNGPMINRMAEQLEPLNREGAILLGSVPSPDSSSPPSGDRLRAAISLGQQMALQEAELMLALKTRQALSTAARAEKKPNNKAQ
jgi:hypothetical protein